MRPDRRVLRLALPCALALVGCNDHRYGFFPETDGDGTGTTSLTTISPSTTTVSPTTVSPTTVQPTTLPPTTSTVTTDPTTETTTGGNQCGQIALGSDVPQQFFGSLGGQGDEFSLSCGGVGGSDLALVWDVPFNARYQIDTIGSNFDSLVAVIDGTCFGAELVCDDDSGGSLTSRVEVDLFGGQRVTIVVDSFGGFGDIVLNISEVPDTSECPDIDFGSEVPFLIPGQTAGAPNVRSGSCGGSDSPEIEARWTPPFDGLFRFQILEADFDPVMYMLFDHCEGFEGLCNDDFNGLMPQFETLLVGGQPVILVVDGIGSQGKFTLSIDAI